MPIVLTCQFCSLILEIGHIFKRFINNIRIIIWSCLLASLTSDIKACVFFSLQLNVFAKYFRAPSL
jgi:hypothetical protein